MSNLVIVKQSAIDRILKAVNALTPTVKRKYRRKAKKVKAEKKDKPKVGLTS